MNTPTTTLWALALLVGGCALEVPPRLDGYRADGAVPVDATPDTAVTPDAARACPAYLTTCGDRCVDTRVDALHCGGCGQRCASGFCRDGMCVGVCDAGSTSCGGACVDTRADNNHCGFCGHACSALRHNAACMDGACRCDDGFTDCNGVVSDGCETNTAVNLDHCGACGNRCAGVHSSARCATGTCADFACDAGWANCDGFVGNGCEIDLSAPAHCGACSNRCASPAHATGVCVTPALRCGFVCDARYADCNNNASDGCEVSLDTDNRNCGACGVFCNGTCVRGRCAPS